MEHVRFYIPLKKKKNVRSMYGYMKLVKLFILMDINEYLEVPFLSIDIVYVNHWDFG